MANIIQLKRSSVAGKRPNVADLQVGEIAVNLADGILYTKNTAGYITVVGSAKTSNVIEDGNLYFTNARAVGAFTAGTGISIDANGLILSTVTGGEGGGGGGSNVTVSSSPPDSPQQGDVWIDAETGVYLTYFSDGDSSQWAEVASSVVFGGQGGGVADLTSNIVIGTDGDPTNVIIHSTITGNLTPSDNEVYDLGSADYRWRDLYLSGNTIALGNATISASGDGIVLPANTTVGAAAIASPRISSIDYPGDDTAADPDGGQTVSIVGSGFVSGASVILGTTTVGVVSFISSTELQITTPAKAAGSYTLYVINPDGGTGIFIPGFQYSGTPTWNTAAGSLGSVYETGSISETLNATSDGTVTYSLLSGTLPAGSTLDANAGTITGTASNVDSPTTYNFTIRATDEENQDTDRAFSLTIDPDAISWTTPTEGSVVQLEVDAASNTNLLATTLSGDTVSYSANSLPSGLTLTGNVISGTPNVVGDSYTTLTALGDNTNKSNVISITWSISVTRDPFFYQTSLLLNGDGIDSSQNNTFIDSSSNNYTVTRNGSPTQGTFSPYNSGWSLYVNNTKTSWPAAAWSGLSGSTFTAEYWFKPFSNGGIYGGTIFGINKSGSTNSVFMFHSSTGTVGITTAGASNFTSFGTTETLPLNTWTHVAITIEGVSGSATGKIYLNGTLVKTQTNMATSIPDLGVGSFTGTRGDGSQYALYGNLSSLRIVKDQVLYTGNFTPPYGPLTADSVGTSGDNVASSITGTVHFLSYRDSTILNLGTSGSSTGNASVLERNFPITLSETYNPSVNGGSGYFPGVNGNYLRLGSSGASSFGTNPFTIEVWIYALEFNRCIYDSRNTSTGQPNHILFTVNSSNLLQVYNGNTLRASSSIALRANSWNHVVLVREGTGTNQSYFFINGVNAGTFTLSDTFTDGTNPVIGAVTYTPLGNAAWFGYMCDLRIVNGTAVYTSNFNTPTTPLEPITNTSLLLNFTNAGIKDLTGKNNIETVGNAQISTSVKKYGSGSMAFDGTGDYLTVPQSNLFEFGGAFTMECWVYINTLPSNEVAFFESIDWNGQLGQFCFGISDDNKLLFYMYDGQNRYYKSSATLSTSQWIHCAVTRDSSGNGKLFINGSNDGTFTNSYALTNIQPNPYKIGASKIGAAGAGAVDGYFNGYIDDLRITKGVARYTSSFDPLTSAFGTK